MANPDAPLTAEFILSQHPPNDNEQFAVMNEVDAELCEEKESAAIIDLLRQPVGSAEVETTPEQRARPCGFNNDGCWQRINNDEGSMNNRIHNRIGLETKSWSIVDEFDVINQYSFVQRFLRLYRSRHPEIYDKGIDGAKSVAQTMELMLDMSSDDDIDEEESEEEPKFTKVEAAARFPMIRGIQPMSEKEVVLLNLMELVIDVKTNNGSVLSTSNSNSKLDREEKN